MSPHILRLLIDATDALANQYRAQLAVAEARPQARPLCERMLREREQQYERAKARLEAATIGRAA